MCSLQLTPVHALWLASWTPRSNLIALLGIEQDARHDQTFDRTSDLEF